MPYLSHPVRRIRDDPTEGRKVSLLLAFDEDDADPPIEAVEDAVDDVGGTVDRRLAFATVEVTVPETAVAAICGLDGLSHVETSGTLGLAVETVDDGGGDERADEQAAETVDPERESDGSDDSDGMDGSDSSDSRDDPDGRDGTGGSDDSDDPDL